MVMFLRTPSGPRGPSNFAQSVDLLVDRLERQTFGLEARRPAGILVFRASADRADQLERSANSSRPNVRRR